MPNMSLSAGAVQAIRSGALERVAKENDRIREENKKKCNTDRRRGHGDAGTVR